MYFSIFHENVRVWICPWSREAAGRSAPNAPKAKSWFSYVYTIGNPWSVNFWVPKNAFLKFSWNSGNLDLPPRQWGRWTESSECSQGKILIFLCVYNRKSMVRQFLGARLLPESFRMNRWISPKHCISIEKPIFFAKTLVFCQKYKKKQKNS